ncbi:MAG: LysE family translocator [Muribaculaceae bacterium]|nr:LysE family translocator [Muribaculaceae bacterium]
MNEFMYILPRGLAIGILISAPMGPIGMLIIQRTLSKGRWPAFFTGIGAAFSDLLYCLLTGLGISFITDFIEQHQFGLQMLGALVLAAFGVYLFRKNPTRALKPNEITVNNYWLDLVTGFLLTFSNPLILFFIIGLFAQFSFILPEFGPHHFIVGYSMIFAGALLWWYLITMLVNKLRSRFNVRSLWLINRIIGGVLIGMAVVGAGYGIHNEYIAPHKVHKTVSESQSRHQAGIPPAVKYLTL